MGANKVPVEYVRAPSSMAVAGRPLETDLYIYMPLNKTFVKFRGAGTVLSPEDLVTMAKVPLGNLVIERSQQAKVLANTGQGAIKAINEGKVDTPEVKEHAGNVLSSIDAIDSGVVAREALRQVPELVQGMLTQFKRTPSVDAYEQTLARFKGQDDPLDRHHHQVSALAVLIQMTVGGGTADDLTDLGSAGLIHDLGLAQLPRSIQEKHLKGEEFLSSSEQLLHLKHITLLLETIKQQRLPVTPGAMRIIELHHENWDGTGFKMMTGAKIYRPARVFRIADDIVCAMNQPERELDYSGALKQLSSRSLLEDDPSFYDPTLLEQLLGAVL